MTAILIVAGLTLLTSFLCSILEATLYSVTLPQLEVMQRERVRGARRFLRFRADVEEPIAAILTINTIANTAGSTFSGWLVAAWAGSAALGWFTAVFTLMVLLVAEIVPKSLGVRYAKQLVPYLALPLQVIVFVAKPLARLCKLLMHRLTGGAHGGHLPTTEEIIAMSKLAERVGELSPREVRWVENALRLDEVTAHDLMTPRTVVHTLSADRLLSSLAAEPEAVRNSRLPVTEGGSSDVLVGVVHLRDIFEAIAQGSGERTVRDIMRPIDFVPEGMSGEKLLQKFIRGKRHMVAVIDEYGGFEGIVTLEDVLEDLLGAEIVDEHDEHVDMQEFARRQALARVLEQRHESDTHGDGAAAARHVAEDVVDRS